MPHIFADLIITATLSPFFAITAFFDISYFSLFSSILLRQLLRLSPLSFQHSFRRDYGYAAAIFTPSRWLH